MPWLPGRAPPGIRPLKDPRITVCRDGECGGNSPASRMRLNASGAGRRMRSTIALAWRCRPVESGRIRSFPAFRASRKGRFMDGHLAALMLSPPSDEIFLKTTEPHTAGRGNGAIRKVSDASGSSGGKLDAWGRRHLALAAASTLGVLGEEARLADLAPVRAGSSMGVDGLDFGGEKRVQDHAQFGSRLKGRSDGPE